MKYRVLHIAFFISMISCKRTIGNKTIPGRYYGSDTDAFLVIELDKNGDAKRYNSHMGGDFEWSGKWSYKRDSVQLVFYRLNTIFEGEEIVNDTVMWPINKQNGSLSFLKKINDEKEKKEMTEKFIEKTKLSVRKYDEE